MPYNSRQNTENCDRPVIQNKPQFGSFKAPFKEINLLDSYRPYLLPGNIIKKIQLREWQAFQINNCDFFIMIALYNAKKISLVQFIVYDIKNDKKHSYEKKVLPWSINVPNTLYNSTASYTSRNFSIAVEHDLGANLLDIKVAIKRFGKLPDLSAHFVGEHNTDLYQPSVVCLPFTERRAMYSHKSLMPVKGHLTIDKQHFPFKKEESQLIIDDHKGFYPFPTRYDWLTGMQRLSDGTLLGFNLTDNQVLNQEKFNENCLWYNGVLHPLPPIKFNRPEGYRGSWTIKDKYGMVDLTFRPVVHHAVDVNLLLFRSKYQGPYGYINGFLKMKDGNKVFIEDMFGMGEDFYLRV